MVSKVQKQEFYQTPLHKVDCEGVFLVGVQTTSNIQTTGSVQKTSRFCHATCPPGKPKFKNCEFYKTAEKTCGHLLGHVCAAIHSLIQARCQIFLPDSLRPLTPINQDAGKIMTLKRFQQMYQGHVAGSRKDLEEHFLNMREQDGWIFQ